MMDLTTLALFVSQLKVQALREQASECIICPYKHIILSNMDVDEAALRYEDIESRTSLTRTRFEELCFVKTSSTCREDSHHGVF